MRRRAVMAGVLLSGLPPVAASRAADDETTLGRLGVYKGSGCDGRAALAGYSEWLGQPPGWIIDFLAQETWKTFHASASWITNCWRGYSTHLSLAVPMLPKQDHATLENGAAGAYDHHFQRLAQVLVAADRPGAVLRLGWEFNGNWSTWCPAHDPEAFVLYWRRITHVMKSVPGAKFRFDWNPTLGRAAIPPDAVYPGDDAVDVIGLDVYNQSWKMPRLSAEHRWKELRQQPFGLDWHYSFARAKGKPRSFPEWGTGRRPDGSGGGDDPLFIAEMIRWIEVTDVVYHGYWDYPASDYDALMSTGRFPRAEAEFLAHFGRGGHRLRSNPLHE